MKLAYLFACNNEVFRMPSTSRRC